MRVIPLSEFGLLTLGQAAELKGCDRSTVREWVYRDRLPAVIVGAGRSATYLVRAADLDGLSPAPVGAPTGNRNARKPKKPSTSARSRKKSRNP